MISLWIIWTIAFLILLVLELCTNTVAALCLSVGCLASVIPAACDASIPLQVVIFVVVSILAFVFLRPLLKKMGFYKHSKEYRTNMDALIGRTGKVTKEITNNFDDGGRVQIDGDNWQAYTKEPDWPIHRGDQVVVEAYDSIVLTVRRLK